MNLNIDTILSDPKNEIRWLPYVGAKYFEANCKILIIGESHYDNPWDPNKLSDKPEFTRLIVNELGIQKIKYERRTGKLFNEINKLINDVDGKIWEHISFYNFIQTVMDDRNIRPLRNHYVEGWKTFRNVLDCLKPDVCIFIGTEASNTLSSLENEEEVKIDPIVFCEKINRTYLRTSSIEIKGHKSNLIFVKHLSKYASTHVWRGKILHYAPQLSQVI